MTRYLSAVASLSLGMYIHVILFNLYLGDLGFREDAMGRLAAAMTLGTALGTLPAAALARRFGLKPVMMAAFQLLALALIARVTVVTEPALLAASFLAGLAMAAYVVTNPPAIAALAGEKQRAAAFSGNLALSIGIGALGGVLAGWLPGVLHSTRAALLLAAALPLAAFLVVSGLRIPSPAITPGRNWRTLACRGFLRRFLGAVALWYAFTAGVGPFFNIYFSRQHGASTQAIGGVFAASQVVQALAALSMAWWIARLGLVRSVVLTQVLASLAVLAFLPARGLAPAAAVYMIYMSLQVMSSPGLQNFLMDRVPAEERAAAAALNELLILVTNAVVVWAAGHLITRSGYEPLFVGLAALGCLAALVFRQSVKSA